MPVTGDFGKLERLAKQVRRLIDPALRRDLGTAAGQAGLALVQQAFERGEAPTGASWLPLKARQGQPLLDTGRLRNSLHARASATGFTVATDVVYAAIQNYGGSVTRPPRVNAHAKSGRFLSRRRAESLKGKAVRISFTGASSTTIPARPFLPSGGLSPAWKARMAETFDSWIREQFR